MRLMLKGCRGRTLSVDGFTDVVVSLKQSTSLFVDVELTSLVMVLLYLPATLKTKTIRIGFNNVSLLRYVLLVH